jgi:hypothetical protein
VRRALVRSARVYKRTLAKLPPEERNKLLSAAKFKSALDAGDYGKGSSMP